MIPFNKPFFTGNELKNIQKAIQLNKISGNGFFTEKCHRFFEDYLGFNKVLLTTSCTDALEMAAILIDTKPGDEIIMPSYTFPSTANAFVLRGAKIVFVDSRQDHPGMDEDKIEAMITEKTKAIVPMHYAGVACDMDKIMKLAKANNLTVIEDAAQGIDALYKNQVLGSIGHLSTFSFHETKNIISGEGGMLVINDTAFIKRAEVIKENGTNRIQFLQKEVKKYSWVDIGSSFMPSDIIAAVLFAQLEKLKEIQNRRKKIWKTYDYYFRGVIDNEEKIGLPYIPDYATNNAHMYYLVCSNEIESLQLINHLRQNGIQAVFHYTPLHQSEIHANQSKGIELKNNEHYAKCLVRLPLFYELTDKEQNKIINSVLLFFQRKTT